jgi:O-antigen/teichoic acid export membrane protein
MSSPAPAPLPSSPVDLKGQVLAGSVWVILGMAVDKVSTIAMFIVTARILGPAGVGLINGVFVPYVFLAGATEVVLLVFLTQHRAERMQEVYDTAWTLNIIRGAAVAVAFAAIGWGMYWKMSAPYLREQMPVTVLCLTGALFVSGWYNSNAWRFEREMNYRRMEIRDKVPHLIQMALMIVAVAAVPEPRALAAANLAGCVARVAFSFAMVRERPRFRLDRRAVRAIWDFGKHIILIAVLSNAVSQADRAIVLAMLGTGIFGLYTNAQQTATSTLTNFGSFLDRLLFPAYTAAKDDPARMARGYIQSVRLAAFFSMLAGSILAVHAHEIVQLVFGRDWSDGILAVRVFGAFVMFSTCDRMAGSVIFASGRPGFGTRTMAANLAMVLVAVPVAAWWCRRGIVEGRVSFGESAAVVAAVLCAISAVKWCITNFYLTRILGLPHRVVWRPFLLPCIMGAASGASVWWIRWNSDLTLALIRWTGLEWLTLFRWASLLSLISLQTLLYLAPALLADRSLRADLTGIWSAARRVLRRRAGASTPADEASHG